MAGRSASIMVKILGDDTGLGRALGTAEGKLATFAGKMDAVGKKMQSAGTTMTAGFTLPLVGLGALSVKAFAEAEQAQAQLDASLQSTGAKAWTSADQIDRLASSMQDKLAIDGDLVKSGASVLLTFTNVQNKAGEGNDIFNQATVAAADMAAKLGTDLPAANMLLGKALNDPIRGMAALRRAGVQLTEAQVEQVEGFMAVGDIAGAQKVLLGELETQFGGSAKAAADTAAGGMEKLRLKFEDIQESIGERLVPILEKLGGWLERGMAAWDALGERGQTIALVLAGVAAAAGPVVAAIGGIVSVLAFVISPVGLVIAAIAGLVAAFAWFYRSNEAFREWVNGLVALVRDKLLGAFELIAGGVRAFAAAWTANDGDVTSSGFPGFMERLANQLRDIADVVIPALGRAWEWITTVAIPALLPVLADVGAFFAALANRISTVASWIVDNIDEAVRLVVAAFRFLEPVLTVIWQAISSSVSAAITFVRGVIQTVTALIRGDWSAVWNGLRTILSGVWAGIRAIVTGALGLLRVAISAALSAIGAVFSGIWNGIRSATSAAFGAVTGVIRGAMDTASGAVRSALGAIGGLFRGVRSTISSALSGLADLVASPFRAAGRAVRDAWNSTIGGKGVTIPDIPGLPGRGRRFEIPRLHTGGVFNAGGAVEGLALLKSGETVRTRQQEAALSARLAGAPSRSGTTVVVHLEGAVVAGRDAERWLVETIENAVARGARMPRLRTSLTA